MDSLLFSWPTLLLLAIALRMAVRLTYGARGPDPGDLVYDFLTIGSLVLFIVAMVPAILGGIFSMAGLVIVFLAVTTLVEAITQRRAAQRRSVCTLLALFMRQRQQVETSALFAANTLRGWVGRAARKLFAALNQGVPLVQAVRANPGALPRGAAAYLAAGNSAQAQSAALRELRQADDNRMTAVWRSCIDRISYLVSVLLVMTLVLTFVMIRIVPAYIDIFVEFNLSLPQTTNLLIAASNWFMQNLAAPAVFMVLALVVAGFIVGTCYLLDLPVMTWLGDRVFRGRRMADVLRILAVATEARRPIADVLYRVAQSYPSPMIRRRLAPAAAEVVAGGSWTDALRKTRVVTPAEAALLQSAERSGNLVWALRQVAQRRDERIVYRLDAALQVLYPAVILALGALVGFFVISLFVPIITLIQSLTL